MKMVNIVRVRHIENKGRKDYAFEIGAEYCRIKKGARVVIEDKNGMHIGICTSDSVRVSENGVDKFTDGMPLTGKVLGVVFEPWEYGRIDEIVGVLTNLGVVFVPECESSCMVF